MMTNDDNLPGNITARRDDKELASERVTTKNY